MRCQHCTTATNVSVTSHGRPYQRKRYIARAPQSLLICASQASAVELASAQDSQLSGAGTATFINRSVNNNETIDTQDTLVVMGDCKRGSKVCSKSSIIVLGRYDCFCMAGLLYRQRHHDSSFCFSVNVKA